MAEHRRRGGGSGGGGADPSAAGAPKSRASRAPERWPANSACESAALTGGGGVRLFLGGSPPGMAQGFFFHLICPKGGGSPKERQTHMVDSRNHHR